MEVCGIKFIDGPVSPWTNAYPLDWPLPDEIIAFVCDGRIAVTTTDHEEDAKHYSDNHEAYRYRKIKESDLPRSVAGMMRGATYSHADS